jgi:hypothetical protein
MPWLALGNFITAIQGCPASTQSSDMLPGAPGKSERERKERRKKGSVRTIAGGVGVRGFT